MNQFPKNKRRNCKIALRLKKAIFFLKFLFILAVYTLTRKCIIITTFFCYSSERKALSKWIHLCSFISIFFHKNSRFLSLFLYGINFFLNARHNELVRIKWIVFVRMYVNMNKSFYFREKCFWIIFIEKKLNKSRMISLKRCLYKECAFIMNKWGNYN